MEQAQEQTLSLTEHTLRGEITRVVYENEETAYTIFKLSDTQGVEYSVVGCISGIHQGQSIEVTGRWETHQEYGRQLRAEKFRFVLPSTREGIVRYLSSGMIPGIGPKLAQCIVDHFGEKTLEILDRYSLRLKEIPGVGKKRAEMIRDSWHEHAARSDIFIFLQGLGITTSYCEKLYKMYGDSAAEVVKTNPYRLADEINGIGFISSDRIAASLGIEKHATERLIAGAAYAMNQLTQSGHCCYPREEFIKYSAEILQVELPQAELGIAAAVEKQVLIISGDMVYNSGLYKAEVELPGHIRRLAGVKQHHGQRLSKVLPRKDLNLSPEQLLAVDRVAQAPLSIITGGPGVGKTTVVGEIVRRAVAAGVKVYLAAPTGRAAKRMSESTNFSARTIHRLLKWDPGKKGFEYNSKHRLPCELLIVDEVSMLDIGLALYLFRALNPGTTVILVGDADQLPSVGPGTVLHSFIKSGLFLVTNLTQIFRQGAGSNIIYNAHNVNRGIMPELPESDRGLSDFYWIEQDDPDKTLELIVRMAEERIPKRFGFDPVNDLQILTPMNRGTCGTASINALLQEKLNPGPKPQFKLGERTYKAGDKVMQTSNNYDKNVFNGDLGRIGQIDNHNKKFSVFFDSVRIVEYNFYEADQLSLAYAITVHKAQGSEFPAVIVPMLTQHYMMLQRNLLYTAMTRAKKLLVLIGSKKAVSMAVKNTHMEPRYSLLYERLLDIKTGNFER